MTQNIVQFSNVTFGYNNLPVLHNFSLSVKPGSFSFITGKSGEGKTTFFKLITRQLLPQNGDIFVLGESLKRLPYADVQKLRKNVGIVFQDDLLFEDMTVLENLMLLSHKGSHVKSLLTWMGVDPALFYRHPTSLSSLNKKVICLARAILCQPVLLLIDEPLGCLDDDAANHFINLLEEVQKKIGATILLSTHNKNIVASYPYSEIQLHEKNYKPQKGAIRAPSYG